MKLSISVNYLPQIKHLKSKYGAACVVQYSMKGYEPCHLQPHPARRSSSRAEIFASLCTLDFSPFLYQNSAIFFFYNSGEQLGDENHRNKESDNQIYPMNWWRINGEIRRYFCEREPGLEFGGRFNIFFIIWNLKIQDYIINTEVGGKIL